MSGALEARGAVSPGATSDGAVSSQGRGVALVGALTFAGFLATLNGQITTPLLPAMAKELAVSPAAIGQLVSVAGLAGVALGLFAGPLSDRHGRRKVLLAAALSLVVSCAGSALSYGYAALFASRFAAGVGAVLLLPAALAAVGDFIPERSQSRAIGAVMGGTGLSLVVGWPVTSLSASHFGWRSAFVGLAAAFLVLTFALAATLPSERAVPVAEVRLGTYRELLDDRRLRVLLLSNLLAASAWFAVTTYLGVFLSTRGALTGEHQAAVLAATGVLYAVGSGLGGAMAPRLGPMRLMVVCSVAASLLSLVLAKADWALGLFALLGLAAMRGAGITVMTSTMVRLRASERGAVSGLNAAFFSVGIAAGAALGGAALSAKGLSGLFGFVSAMSAAAALVLVLGRSALVGEPGT